MDYGNQRVQKFNAIGDVVPAFCVNVQASGLLQQPADIALREVSGKTWVLVVDTSSSTVFVFDADGRPVLDSQGHPRFLRDSHLTRPMGIAADGEALYVGDNASSRVLRFHVGDGFEYVGTAIGYQGPVAALLLDGQGGLWVHSGDALPPIKLDKRKGYSTIGTLVTVP